MGLEKPHPKRARLLRLAGLFFLSLILCAYIAELQYRRILIKSYHRKITGEFDKSKYELVAAPRIYQLKASTHGEMAFNDIPSKRMPFRTNSLGLRGPEIPPKNAERFRILVLGDSYTFGWAIEEEETYPSQIQAQLQAEGVNVEIINGGIPGYGTFQEQDFLEYIYPKLQPNFVILGFAMNDAEPQRIVPQDPDQIYRFSKSWMWEDLKSRWIQKSYFGYQKLHSDLYKHDGHYLAGFSQDSPKWKEAKQALAKINQFCGAHHIGLLVLILPDMNSRFDDSYQFGLIHKSVISWARELKIDAIDVFSAFRGKNNADYYVAGDGHPNKAANQIIARQAVLYLTNFLKTKQN